MPRVAAIRAANLTSVADDCVHAMDAPHVRNAAAIAEEGGEEPWMPALLDLLSRGLARSTQFVALHCVSHVRALSHARRNSKH